MRIIKKGLFALLSLLLLVTGCAKVQTSAVTDRSDNNSEIIPETTAEISTETDDGEDEALTEEVSEEEVVTEPEAEPEPFEFNPHVYTELMSEYCTKEMWDSFYNMIDAIRAGGDTFECSDEKAYEWCLDPCTIGNYYPPACTLVVGDGYENGVGRLAYKMDKEEFAARAEAFEEEITRMVNEAVRSDYSEFEKVMCMYEYMCRNFVYDYEPLDGQGIDDFSTYACLMKKNGICCEIASAYTYLLYQCGVEAIHYGQGAYHDWVYVVVGGKGYHVDPTWALHGENPDYYLYLQYFMMTEEERISQGFDRDKFEVGELWYLMPDYDLERYSATDETFKPLHCNAYFEGM
ncbi:MAG: transglutaminase-like domain-containing protein, partial [Lachnospiraceae bacterium]|nr:transglutaminase-like domain-containing protein [Lachnospiraceae bacterium]